MLVLQIGKKYLNREGSVIKITSFLEKHNPYYFLGDRYRGNDNRTYKPDGSFSLLGRKSPLDLVSEA